MKKMYAVFLSYVAEISGEQYYNEYAEKRKERDSERSERIELAKEHMMEKLGKIAEMAVE